MKQHSSIYWVYYIEYTKNLPFLKIEHLKLYLCKEDLKQRDECFESNNLMLDEVFFVYKFDRVTFKISRYEEKDDCDGYCYSRDSRFACLLPVCAILGEYC